MQTRKSLMNRCKSVFLFTLIVSFLALPSLAADTTQSEGWNAGWENGIYLKRDDGYYKLRIGGRFYGDFAAIEGVPIDESSTGVEIRSARLFVGGTLFKRIGFKVQYDFARQKLKDAYISLKKLPIAGTFLVGQFKEPFSLEEMTSSRFIPFMERSLAAAFNPARNFGMMLTNTAFAKRMTWAVGAFRDSNDADGTAFGTSGGYDLTGRVTAAPIYANGGAQLIHLGVSYSHQFRSGSATCETPPPNEENLYVCIDWDTKPEAHLGPNVANTRKVESDGANLLNLGLAGVLGPLAIQGEYTSAWVKNADDKGNRRFWGGYIEVTYFLTGEHRNYLRKKGAFGRVDVLKPFDKGWGAWELGFRYSRVNLGDQGVGRGNVQDFTVGLNWYLFPNVRMMANYIHSQQKDSAFNPDNSDKLNIFQARAQIDF